MRLLTRRTARSACMVASVILLSMLFAGPVKGQDVQQFGNQQVITTNADSAQSVYATDLDGDGDRDVLSASWSGNNVAWYENLGSGEFGLQQVITTNADYAVSVFAADLDGEGDNDVLASALNDGKVVWYENTGGGGFSSEIIIDAVGAQSVSATDLDGDGDPDILTETTWYENTGGGTFSDPNVFATTLERPKSSFAEDFDGDGDRDVVSVALDSNNVVWYENLGSGTFSDKNVITTNASGARSVYATDLDGDGDADVLSASSFDNKVAWYENTGGSFSSQKVITTAADAPASVYATDVDGDGDADVLSASFHDDKIAWYENSGGGSFSTQKVITTNAAVATSVFATDVNGDSAPDVLSSSRDDDKIAWYENQVDGTAPSAPTGLQATAGDGQVDLGWDANSEGDLAGYNVYRSTSSFRELANATQVNDAPVGNASYTDTSVANETEYFYRVTAVDTSGNESGPSNEASATPGDQTAPSAPTGLQAAAGDGQVDLGWDANSEGDLAGYNVYRSTSSFQELANATQVNDALVGNASYTDTSVTNETEYFYRVTAVDTSGNESGPSNEASATPGDQTAPSAPANLQATGFDSQVGLGWDSNSEPDLAGYNVYRSTSSFEEVASATKVNDSLVLGSAYGDTTVTNNTEYFYRVTAVDSSGNESAASNEASATPTPPPIAETKEATNVTGTGALLQGRVDPNGKETAVVFEYYPTEQPDDTRGVTAQESPLTGTEPQAVSASISELTPNTEYTFKVVAGNQSGSDTGDTRTFTTKSGAPSPPSNLQATAGDSQVDLIWDANTEPDLDGYNVYRATSSFQDLANATKVTDSLVGDTSHTDTGVSNGTTYYYRVTAVDTSGNESGPSNEASATPGDQTAPSAPANLQATGFDSQVGLGWDSNSEPDLAGYNVYRATGSFQEVANATKVNDSLVLGSAYGDTTVTNNTEYFYRVTAVDSSGNESAASNEASAIPRPPPEAETKEATNVTGTGALLQGRVDPNGKETAVVFEYYPTEQPDDTRGATAQESPLTGTEPQAVSASISGLSPNTEYTFRVVAGSESGSDTGSTRTFTTKASLPAAPKNLQATAGEGQVGLDWDANTESDLDGYNVYRLTSSFQEVANATKINRSLVGDPSYTDTDVTVGRKYYYRVTAVDTSGNESTGSNEASATPTLNVTLERTPETPEKGSTLAVTATVSEGFTPSEVARLYYRRTGEQGYQTTPLEAADETSYEGTVPGRVVTERGVEYYVRLSNGTVNVTVPERDPGGDPRYAPVQVSGLKAGIDLTADQYQMISVPLRLDTKDAFTQLRDDFGELDRSTWRLLRWNPATESYDEVTTEGGTGQLVPEQAYWLITQSGETRDGQSTFDVGAGRSVSADPIKIALPPGWTQVANPRPYAVAWSAVNGHTSVMAPVAYDPAAPDSLKFNVQVLHPWTGYWVFNPGESTVQIEVGSPEAEVTQGSGLATNGKSSGAGSLFEEEPAYAVALTAGLQQKDDAALRDVHTVMGVAEAGKPGVGLEDVAEPPPIGDHLRLSIVEDDTRLAGSLRPTGKEGYKWDLEMSASGAERGHEVVRGELEARGALPPGFERRLLDRDTGQRIPITEGTFRVQLTGEQPVRHLRLIVGTQAFAEEESEAIQPDQTGLRSVYPNPSRGNVSVDYHLKSAQRVRIRIYDVLGRRVKTLVDERRPSGHHTVRWNARFGSVPVASGAYIVRMKTESTSVSRRVSIMR